MPYLFYILSVSFFFYVYAPHRDLHSFPTRRSSDLVSARALGRPAPADRDRPRACGRSLRDRPKDRKSTRLNSSHANISYAVFCLKKKKNKKIRRDNKGVEVHNCRGDGEPQVRHTKS